MRFRQLSAVNAVVVVAFDHAGDPAVLNSLL
jgi:hypothetical protein